GPGRRPPDAAVHLPVGRPAGGPRAQRRPRLVVGGPGRRARRRVRRRTRGTRAVARRGLRLHGVAHSSGARGRQSLVRAHDGTPSAKQLAQPTSAASIVACGTTRAHHSDTTTDATAPPTKTAGRPRCSPTTPPSADPTGMPP